jgi:phosphoribosylaminoimidazole carboxylase (NCAIR synthetase)
MQEKQLFSELRIPIPGYHVVSSRQDMDIAAEKLGLPMV